MAKMCAACEAIRVYDVPATATVHVRGGDVRLHVCTYHGDRFVANWKTFGGKAADITVKEKN